jgi:hypothetical protein
MKNLSAREKLFLIAIVFFAGLTFYFATTRKIEVKFSKPVSLIGNFVSPDRNDIWSNKQ